MCICLLNSLNAGYFVCIFVICNFSMKKYLLKKTNWTAMSVEKFGSSAWCLLGLILVQNVFKGPMIDISNAIKGGALKLEPEFLKLFQ